MLAACLGVDVIRPSTLVITDAEPNWCVIAATASCKAHPSLKVRYAGWPVLLPLSWHVQAPSDGPTLSPCTQREGNSLSALSPPSCTYFKHTFHKSKGKGQPKGFYHCTTSFPSSLSQVFSPPSATSSGQPPTAGAHHSWESLGKTTPSVTPLRPSQEKLHHK